MFSDAIYSLFAEQKPIANGTTTSNIAATMKNFGKSAIRHRATIIFHAITSSRQIKGIIIIMTSDYMFII